jgi:hypothetical protein
MTNKAIFSRKAKAWGVGKSPRSLAYGAMFTEDAAKRIAKMLNHKNPPPDLPAIRGILIEREGFPVEAIYASPIKTPQTHPDHHTVGGHYAGHSLGHNSVQIYFCDSYDPRQGYWLTNVTDPTDRKNVSERAIDRTFMSAEDQGESWWVSRWSTRYSKGKTPAEVVKLVRNRATGVLSPAPAEA